MFAQPPSSLAADATLPVPWPVCWATLQRSVTAERASWSVLAALVTKLDGGWAHTTRCATKYRRGPWLVGGRRGKRLWHSRLVRLAVVLGNKLFTAGRGWRAAAQRSKALGNYGHDEGGLFSSVTANWLATGGEVLEHTDSDHGASVGWW